MKDLHPLLPIRALPDLLQCPQVDDHIVYLTETGITGIETETETVIETAGTEDEATAIPKTSAMNPLDATHRTMITIITTRGAMIIRTTGETTAESVHIHTMNNNPGNLMADLRLITIDPHSRHLDPQNTALSHHQTQPVALNPHDQ